jgi:very-short-patch-repair endonuclease
MRRITGYAQLLKDLISSFGFRVDEEVSDGHKHIDLSIDSAKLDIEVDGLQHLTNSDQILRDMERSGYSREDGYETIRVHNIDITQEPVAIAKAIAEVAEKREDDLSVLAGLKK